MQTLNDQIETLSIKEKADSVDKMTNVLKMMRDQLMNLEFDDETETDSDYDDVNAAHALLEEIESNPDFAKEFDENLSKSSKVELWKIVGEQPTNEIVIDLMIINNNVNRIKLVSLILISKKFGKKSQKNK